MGALTAWHNEKVRSFSSTAMKKSSISHLVAAALAAWTGLHAGSASATDLETFTVTSNGKAMFNVTILGSDFHIDSESWLGTHTNITQPPFVLNSHLLSGVNEGLTYWADMLAPQSANPDGLSVFLTTIDDANAYAEAFCGNSDGYLFVANWLQQGTNYVPGTFESLKKSAVTATPDKVFNQQTFTIISIGTELGSTVSVNAGHGWHVDASTLLATNEAAADLVGTVRHEMGHALGIATNVNLLTDATGTTTARYPLSDDTLYSLTTFEDFEGTNLFADHLYDYTGTKAKDSMPIVSDAMYEYFTSNKTLTAPKSEVFLLEPETSDNVAARYAYFKGEHVSEVLNGATYHGIDGLPVNGWEYSDTDDEGTSIYQPELSHLQTNGMMSHITYTNLTSFLEVELAVMQDIGYRFDRKNYYGWSEYRDGQNYDNWQGYSLRNASGTGWIVGEANETPLAVGLDIEGHGNTIRQRADILTIGTGSAGIRVNGSGNFLTVAGDAVVHADGLRGIGVLVSAGTHQRLDVDGVVTADGIGGRALQLDYGSSSNGARDDYVGSYIYYTRSVEDDGTISKAGNYINGSFLYSDDSSTTPKSLLDPLGGPLLTSVNLSGTVSGEEDAIYIGKNAFVHEINFLGNARVTGDITSEWKHFDAVAYPYLQLNYNEKLIAPTLYVPDLVTTLRFAGDNVRVDGDISAVDNSRVVFSSGTASVNGRVATTSVDIAEGAVAKGNAQYQLTRKASLTAAEGYAVEDNVGRFTNAGTLAPGNSIGAVTIDGDYVQTETGTLEIEVSANGATDKLTVNNGNASVSGSLVLKPLAGYYKETQTIRLSEVLVTSDYSSVTPTVVTDDSASPTLTMSVSESGEGADASYTLAYARDYASWATNRNETAVAHALENATSVSEPMQSLFSTIDFSASDGSDVRQALRALQPGLQADVARSLLASRQNFVNWRHDALQRAALTGDGRRLYAVPYGQHESRHSDSDGWRADETGVFAGLESATGGNVISWHGTLAKKTVKSRQNRGEASAVSLAVSADSLWKPQGDFWNVTAGASAAYDAVHAKRRITFAGQNYRNDDRYAVWSAGVFAGTGIDIPIASVTLTPYARLNYNVLRQGDVKESGDSTALSVHDATLQSLSSSLGLRATATTTADDGTAAAFAASLAWNHEFLSRFGRFHAAFRGAENASFTTNVEPLTRESVEAMASLKLEKGNFAFGALLGGEVFSGTGAEGFLQLQMGWRF